jgi:hypothetical protein
LPLWRRQDFPVEVNVLLRVRRWRGFHFASLLLLLLCARPGGAVWAHPAWGIQMNRQGELYFADVQRDRIWLINGRGTLIPVLNDKHSHDLWLDQSDNVFGEHVSFDAAHNQWRTSRWQLSINEQLTELGAPPVPGLSLFHDAAGNTFVVESTEQQVRLLRRAPDGQLTLLAGGPRGHADGQGAAASFNQIEALTLGYDGALYLHDQNCIRRVSATGEVTTLGGNPLAGLARESQPALLGVATDRSGNVFVADTAQHALRKIDPAGHAEVIFETGWFWQPTGVTAVNGDLYILQSAPASLLGRWPVLGIGPYLRVQKLAADGSVHTLATLWGPTTRLVLGSLVLLGALIALWRMRRRETQREVLS